MRAGGESSLTSIYDRLLVTPSFIDVFPRIAEALSDDRGSSSTSTCRDVIVGCESVFRVLQTGVVEGLHMQVDVKPAEGGLLQGIPSDRLTVLHPFSPGQFVIGGGWVGRVESIRHNVSPLHTWR